MSDPTTGEWTVSDVSSDGDGCRLNMQDQLNVWLESESAARQIVNAHKAAVAAAALEIKSLKAVEANYNETHQILTNAGVKHEGMDVAFRVNAAVKEAYEKGKQDGVREHYVGK